MHSYRRAEVPVPFGALLMNNSLVSLVNTLGDANGNGDNNFSNSLRKVWKTVVKLDGNFLEKICKV